MSRFLQVYEPIEEGFSIGDTITKIIDTIIKCIEKAIDFIVHQIMKLVAWFKSHLMPKYKSGCGAFTIGELHYSYLDDNNPTASDDFNSIKDILVKLLDVFSHSVNGGTDEFGMMYLQNLITDLSKRIKLRIKKYTLAIPGGSKSFITEVCDSAAKSLENERTATVKQINETKNIISKMDESFTKGTLNINLNLLLKLVNEIQAHVVEDIVNIRGAIELAYKYFENHADQPAAGYYYTKDGLYTANGSVYMNADYIKSGRF